LLFQSLGYFVSHTRPGERRVDLVIAAPQPCPYVFLLDAKSCQSVYALRTSDERALSEYVSTYQQGSHALPRLRFVLIVSSKPSKGLEKRLAKVSSSVGVPLRFISARELAFLRTHMCGTLHPELFLDSINSSEPILGPQWVKNILKNTDCREKIFDVAVQSIFGKVGPISFAQGSCDTSEGPCGQ
jgi:hypothetical protein